MIFDRNDSLEAASHINYTPFLTAPHADTPFAAVGISPDGTSTISDLGTPIRITLSEKVEPTSLTADNFYMENAQTKEKVAANISFDSTQTIITLTPSAPFDHDQTYSVILTGVTSISGKELFSSQKRAFSTTSQPIIQPVPPTPSTPPTPPTPPTPTDNTTTEPPATINFGGPPQDQESTGGGGALGWYFYLLLLPRLLRRSLKNLTKGAATKESEYLAPG